MLLFTGTGAAPTPVSQLENISTRTRVDMGDKQGIGGFIITGSAPKRVIIRGLGPSLAQSNVAGVLADPVLELHDSSGQLITTNDNWRDTQEPEIKATRIPPVDDRESAIVATLPPGGYTAILGGKNGSAGLGLIEVYNLDPSDAASRLGNISTRADVGIGNNVVIGGFILGSGNNNANIVIRGLGPSLDSAGVPNPLPDPTLELRNADGALLISNNNWKDDPSQAALVAASGLAPKDDREAAIAANLSPGRYTAILGGKNDGTGIGLVEIYNLQ